MTKQILSNDPRQAVEEMLKITEEVIARIEIETSAVATNDGTTFTMNEANKEYVADIYENAANEFHKRIHEFDRVDKGLIGKLDAAQKSLGQTTKNNLKLLKKLQDTE
jgi:seryl-tRNA synthetase